MNEIIFQKGHIIITPKIFKTARRTYKISHIERLHIKRPWFLFSLPLSVGSACLLNTYYEYLYAVEVWFCIASILVLPFVLYNLGTLCVTSKSYTNDTAITGWMPTLIKTRHALETVLYGNDHVEEALFLENQNES